MEELSKKVAAIRMNYRSLPLEEKAVRSLPVQQLELWMQEALASEVYEPTAMHLSTVDNDGKPNGRIVLLKGIDENGITFFTNYESHKGLELSKTPYAAVTFFWPELHRQVRWEGKVEKVGVQESDEYFASRPRESQLGAWASDQSKTIPSREFLEQRMKEIQQQYEGKSVPRPAYWGGYKIFPEQVEFWQGRENRLHDRILYTKSSDGWKIERLSP